MTVESASYVASLNPAYPETGDSRAEGDDHLRVIKLALVQTFPNLAGAMTKTHAQLNATPHDQAGVVSLLGFTPVQQGTGVSQQAGVTIKLGWNGTRVAATVGADNVNLGGFAMLSDFTGGNQSITSSTSGYQRLPGGLLVQWGHLTGLAMDAAVGSVGTTTWNFPVAFNAAPIVFATNSVGTGGEGIECTVANVSATTLSATLQFLRVYGTNAGGETFATSLLAFGR